MGGSFTRLGAAWELSATTATFVNLERRSAASARSVNCCVRVHGLWIVGPLQVVHKSCKNANASLCFFHPTRQFSFFRQRLCTRHGRVVSRTLSYTTRMEQKHNCFFVSFASAILISLILNPQQSSWRQAFPL